MEKIWLKSYPPQVPETINPDAYRSLAELFEKTTAKFKDEVAFSNFGARLTYGDLEALSRHFASYLQQLNLKRGDRIAVMLPNCLQYPVVIFAILRAGFTVVNLNPLYTAPELIERLSDSGATAIVVMENFAHTLQNALSETQIQQVIVTAMGDLMGAVRGCVVNLVVRYLKKLVPRWQIKKAIRFKEALYKGQQTEFVTVDINNSDIAFLQYTGGTTGAPKAAMLTHRNMVANILQCVAWMKMSTSEREDIVLGALPLYHIFSLTVCCLTFMMMGAECLLITDPRDLKSLIKVLAKRPVTIFIGINTLFNGLLNHPDIKKARFDRLRLIVGGGMAMQKSVAERWRKVTGVPILEGYGLTEASPAVSFNPANMDHFTGSIGLPFPGTDVVIRDDQRRDLPIGEAGELWVHGPQVMKGYWRSPEETREVIDENGWLRTGDVVRMDERGFIYLVDRIKDVIVVSGFNVYPTQIEQVIASHPGVQDVSVIGIPSEKTGEAVKACIVKKDPALSKADIVTFCRKSMTGYKIPKIIEFYDDLPKSHVGKVLRRSLRDDHQNSVG